MESQTDHMLIARQIRADHRNIPVPGTVADQILNLLCRRQALLVHRFRPADPDTALQFPFHNGALIQVHPQEIHGVFLGCDSLDFHFHAGLLGAPQNLGRRVTGLFEGQHGRCHAVAVDGNGHFR